MLLKNLDINVYDKNGLKIPYTYPIMSVSGFQVSKDQSWLWKIILIILLLAQ